MININRTDSQHGLSWARKLCVAGLTFLALPLGLQGQDKEETGSTRGDQPRLTLKHAKVSPNASTAPQALMSKSRNEPLRSCQEPPLREIVSYFTWVIDDPADGAAKLPEMTHLTMEANGEVSRLIAASTDATAASGSTSAEDIKKLMIHRFHEWNQGTRDRDWVLVVEKSRAIVEGRYVPIPGQPICSARFGKVVNGAFEEYVNIATLYVGKTRLERKAHVYFTMELTQPPAAAPEPQRSRTGPAGASSDTPTGTSAPPEINYPLEEAAPMTRNLSRPMLLARAHVKEVRLDREPARLRPHPMAIELMAAVDPSPDPYITHVDAAHAQRGGPTGSDRGFLSIPADSASIIAEGREATEELLRQRREQITWEPTDLVPARTFFLDLAWSTHPHNPDSAIKAHHEALFPLLVARYEARARQEPIPNSGVKDEHVRGVSSHLASLLAKHLGDGKTPDLHKVAFAFEQFAASYAALATPTEPLNGQPDSAAYFCFAEFAFLAIEHGVDEDLWTGLVGVLVETQQIYIRTYKPRGRSSRLDRYNLQLPLVLSDVEFSKLCKTLRKGYTLVGDAKQWIAAKDKVHARNLQNAKMPNP